MTTSRVTWDNALGSDPGDDTRERRAKRQSFGGVDSKARIKYLATIPDLEASAQSRAQVMLTCICGEELLRVELRDQRELTPKGIESDDLIRFVAVYPSPTELQPPAAADLDVSSVVRPSRIGADLPISSRSARIRFHCGECSFSRRFSWSTIEVYYVLGAHSPEKRVRLEPLPINEVVQGKTKRQRVEDYKPLHQDSDRRIEELKRYGMLKNGSAE